MITFSLGSDSITLRNPDFENAERFEIARLNQKSRGGAIFVFRDSMWPIAKVLDMKFSFLSELKTQQLLNFLDRTLGQVINLTDFEGRDWTGVITTPSGEIVHSGRENKTAHIIFQGNLV